jgi:hypothetical protein
MLNKLGFVTGVLLFLVGVWLLYDAVLDSTQMATLIVGASLFSLGVAIIGLIAKSWWGWKKEVEEIRSSIDSAHEKRRPLVMAHPDSGCAVASAEVSTLSQHKSIEARQS